MCIVTIQRPISALKNVDLSIVPEYIESLISELKQEVQSRYVAYKPSLRPFDTLLFGIKQAIEETIKESELTGLESKHLFIDALYETLEEKLLTDMENRLDYTLVRCTNPVLEQYFGVKGPVIDCSVLLALQSLLFVHLDLDTNPLQGLAKLVLDRLGYEKITDKDLETHVQTLFDKADKDFDLYLALNKLSKAFSVLSLFYRQIDTSKCSSARTALDYLLCRVINTDVSGFSDTLQQYIKEVYRGRDTVKDTQDIKERLFYTYGVVPMYYHPLDLYNQSLDLFVRLAIVNKFILTVYEALEITFTILSQIDSECKLIPRAKIFDSKSGYITLLSKHGLPTTDTKLLVSACSNVVLQYFASIEVGPNITIADIFASKPQTLMHMHYNIPIYLYQDYLVHMFLSELLVPFVETVLMPIAKDIEPEQLIRETENTIKMFGPATLMIDDVVW